VKGETQKTTYNKRSPNEALVDKGGILDGLVVRIFLNMEQSVPKNL